MKDAIYIPAYSDGLMTLLEKSDNDIKEDYQTDFDTLWKHGPEASTENVPEAKTLIVVQKTI